ncbi:MAG: hypothetical protein IRZ10_03375 [Thermoflavifilum sp.]|nr:hypothetical protein [Thermoflavifilum sp.]MCL6513437.1 hypothetical protein [Alicyclobacillus sp.]
MRVIRRPLSNWAPAGIAVLCCLWLWSAGMVSQDMVNPTALGLWTGIHPTATQTGMVPAAADVPEDVMNDIAQAVGAAGPIDELVVLPDGGGGYTVSATLQLGYGPIPDRNTLEKTVSQQAALFFSGLYGADIPVTHAELYWMAGEEVVAGAGLGADAYQRMASAVATGQDGWWQALTARAASASVSGVDEAWAEIRSDIAGES